MPHSDVPSTFFTQYRQTSEWDPGTVRIWFRNATARDRRLVRVKLNGSTVPVWGVDWEGRFAEANACVERELGKAGGPDCRAITESFGSKQIAWARLDPPFVPGRGISELAVKLARRPPGPLMLTLEWESGQEQRTLVDPQPAAVGISAVTFSEDLATVFVYLECRAKVPVSLSVVQLMGVQDVKEAWLSSGSIGSACKELAITRLRRPLRAGEFITVEAKAGTRTVAIERVRVLSGFPIGTESDRSPDGDLGVDASPYSMVPAYLHTERSDSALACEDSQPGPVDTRDPRGICLYMCPTHSFDCNPRRNAGEIFRRYDLCQRFDPLVPCFVHVCRVRPEEGYALFAETTDILRINPNVTTSLQPRAADDTPERIVARIARCAYLSARPGVVHAIEDTTAFGANDSLSTPAECRRRIYATLGQGVKGLFLRHDARKSESPARAQAMADTIRAIHAEIRKVRPLLAVADAACLATVRDSPGTDVYTLLAADQGIVLFVVRHERGPGGTDAPGTGSTICIDLTPPAWLRVCSAASISADAETPVCLEADSRGASLTLPAPEATALVVLKTERRTP
jgi:hypothetical protein